MPEHHMPELVKHRYQQLVVGLPLGQLDAPPITAHPRYSAHRRALIRPPHHAHRLAQL
jgi:hypothetical protein